MAEAPLDPSRAASRAVARLRLADGQLWGVVPAATSAATRSARRS